MLPQGHLDTSVCFSVDISNRLFSLQVMDKKNKHLIKPLSKDHYLTDASPHKQTETLRLNHADTFPQFH